MITDNHSYANTLGMEFFVLRDKEKRTSFLSPCALIAFLQFLQLTVFIYLHTFFSRRVAVASDFGESLPLR